MSSNLPPISSDGCCHTTITSQPSAHAAEVGFKWPTNQQRVSAGIIPRRSKTTQPNQSPKSHNLASDHESFPGPLILPEDDLALDPQYPPQSLRSWLHSKDRNRLTDHQNVIYVAAPPGIASEVDDVSTWTQPRELGMDNHSMENTVSIPDIQDIVKYVAAFYYGMSVKLLPSVLEFVAWDDQDSKPSKAKKTLTKPRFLGLNTSTESIRIRTRASKDNVFPRQLNLDDLLDVAISVLPKDAYALLLLVHQDLNESAEDIFVCGRAYGGSRVAVVSTARYHPSLDRKHGVEREHSWPASHCELYLRKCCASSAQEVEPSRKKARSRKEPTSTPCQSTSKPLHTAISTQRTLPSSSPTTLSGLWLGRVCRTAAHELGHCLGLDHCIYYACAMQGSASIAEDARQPPYLCPVDLAKVLQVTGTSTEQRYTALLEFCVEHEEAQLFVAFAAWLRARLVERGNGEEGMCSAG